MDTVAKSIIEQLTCLNLKAETSTRVFDVRKGYATVFTDPFETVSEVKLDGEVLTTDQYTKMFWDRRNSDVYNSLILSECESGKELSVTAKWVIPAELQTLITNLATTLTKSKSGRVKSKRVEDFHITLNDNTDVQQFALDNAAILAKYSLCNVGYVLHGKTGC